jgi:hypothetical protein
MREELAMNKVRDVAELYTLADKCARAKEGRRLPGEDTGAGVDSEDEGATTKKKGHRHNQKCKGKAMLAVEGSGDIDPAKKAKVDSPGKEVAGCASCQALAAADKPEGSAKQYCKIHHTKGHDLQNCRQVEQLVERQKAEYEKRDKERAQDGAGESSKKCGGRGGHRGKAKQQKEKPARGRDKEEDDDDEDGDESSEHEFQKATEAMCVDGGASLHSSHRQLKQWVREINAAEPAIDARRPLKWSDTPIIFDAEDHPDRTTAIGCFPLLVSPTIRNLKVSKMLVDGGAGLNLISPEVIKRLQIPDGDLEETGTFQGANPRRTS